MALYPTYDNGNKIIQTGKTVTYSKQRVYGTWHWWNLLNIEGWFYRAWEYHRYCNATYQWVGMSYAKARECAEAKISKYTRTTKTSEWNPDGTYRGTFTEIDGGSVCMADVSIQKREGCMYDVVVSVREDDARLSLESVAPSTLFTAENAREYDE